MSDDQKPFTLERAWDDLRYALRWIVAACGWPAGIAARCVLSNKARQDILVWLAPIEAMARRILLLAALKAGVPNLLARRKHRATRIASAMLDAPLREPPENPADWRVLFSDWPRSSGAVRREGDHAGPQILAKEDAGATHVPAHNAYPLARRVEALMRLADDPKPAIARMARKIAEHRALLLVAFAPYRHNALPVESLLAEVQAHVDAALLNTS